MVFWDVQIEYLDFHAQVSPLGWRSDDLNTVVSADLCNTKRDTFIGIIDRLSHLMSFSPILYS